VMESSPSREETRRDPDPEAEALLDMGRDIYARHRSLSNMSGSWSLRRTMEIHAFGTARLPMLSHLQRKWSASGALPAPWRPLGYEWYVGRTIPRHVRAKVSAVSPGAKLLSAFVPPSPPESVSFSSDPVLQGPISPDNVERPESPQTLASDRASLPSPVLPNRQANAATSAARGVASPGQTSPFQNAEWGPPIFRGRAGGRGVSVQESLGASRKTPSAPPNSQATPQLQRRREEAGHELVSIRTDEGNSGPERQSSELLRTFPSPTAESRMSLTPHPVPQTSEPIKTFANENADTRASLAPYHAHLSQQNKGKRLRSDQSISEPEIEQTSGRSAGAPSAPPDARPGELRSVEPSAITASQRQDSVVPAVHVEQVEHDPMVQPVIQHRIQPGAADVRPTISLPASVEKVKSRPRDVATLSNVSPEAPPVEHVSHQQQSSVGTDVNPAIVGKNLPIPSVSPPLSAFNDQGSSVGTRVVVEGKKVSGDAAPRVFRSAAPNPPSREDVTRETELSHRRTDTILPPATPSPVALLDSSKTHASAEDEAVIHRKPGARDEENAQSRVHTDSQAYANSNKESVPREASVATQAVSAVAPVAEGHDISMVHAEMVQRGEIASPGHQEETQLLPQGTVITSPDDNDATQSQPQRVLRQSAIPQALTPGTTSTSGNASPPADKDPSPPASFAGGEIVRGTDEIVSSGVHGGADVSRLKAVPHLQQRLLRKVAAPEADARANAEIPSMQRESFPPTAEVVPGKDIGAFKNSQVQPEINTVRATLPSLRAPVREIHRLSTSATLASPQAGTGTSTSLLQRRPVAPYAAILAPQRSFNSTTVDRTHLRRAPAPGPEQPDAYEATVAMPSASATPVAEPSSTLNIDQLADRVYHLLTDRLASERSRRGM
jgi:hypothetical protein